MFIWLSQALVSHLQWEGWSSQSSIVLWGSQGPRALEPLCFPSWIHRKLWSMGIKSKSDTRGRGCSSERGTKFRKKCAPLSGSGSLAWHWPAVKPWRLLNLSTQQGEWRLLPRGDVCMKQSTAILGDLPGGKVCLLLVKSFSSTDSRVHAVMSWAGMAESRLWDHWTFLGWAQEPPRYTSCFCLISLWVCPQFCQEKKKPPLLHSWWPHTCVISVSFCSFQSGLYLPKFVSFWTSRIFLMLSYGSRFLYSEFSVIFNA